MTPNTTDLSITNRTFGTLTTGEQIEQYTLTNGRGLTVEILTWGGIIRSIFTPDRTGQVADIVLGFDTLEQYETRHPYLGTITGRFANRIARGEFTLDGETYSLAINNGANHLHGGLIGFDRKIWRATTKQGANFVSLILEMTSPDGDEGYPGEVTTQVTYTVNASDELKIDYHATTTKPTPINLTNHSYFNLSAFASPDVLGHHIQLFASSYLPVDETQIPTGEIQAVTGGPFDFLTARSIGSQITEVGLGYDHNYVIDGTQYELRRVAFVNEPSSGRTMSVLSTKPGVQFYTGNFLSGQIGKSGNRYNKHAGFCLETQYFPDSINQKNFPSCVLRPGERYSHCTVLQFGKTL